MRKAFRIIVLIVIIIAVISTVNYCSGPHATETVTYYEFQKSIKGTGYILRDETVLTNDAPGIFEPFVNDGERVSKDARVGTIILGRPDEGLVEELNSVKKRIEDIEKSASIAGLYQSDTLRIANAVKTDVRNLRVAVRDGSLNRAVELKKEIGYLKNRSSGIENNEAKQQLLSELYDRRDEIEATIGGSQQVLYSPISGVYSMTVDGLEKYGKEKVMDSLTPSDVGRFDEIIKKYERDGKELCKITDNFNWYLAAVIDENEAENVVVGNKVNVRIDNASPESVSGEVYSLSNAEDGKRVMIICSNLFVDGISSMRAVDYEVVLQKKTGLRIPSEALRIENGKKGVYILIDKKKRFKYVNDEPFRSEDDKYYIVERKYIPQGSKADYVPLKENDKVLLAPEDVR